MPSRGADGSIFPESGSLERRGTGLRDCPCVVDAAAHGRLGAMRPAPARVDLQLLLSEDPVAVEPKGV
jgi:hypothetical protein